MKAQMPNQAKTKPCAGAPHVSRRFVTMFVTARTTMLLSRFRRCGASVDCPQPLSVLCPGELLDQWTKDRAGKSQRFQKIVDGTLYIATTVLQTEARARAVRPLLPLSATRFCWAIVGGDSGVCPMLLHAPHRRASCSVATSSGSWSLLTLWSRTPCAKVMSHGCRTCFLEQTHAAGVVHPLVSSHLNPPFAVPSPQPPLLSQTVTCSRWWPSAPRAASWASSPAGPSRASPRTPARRC